MSKKRYFFVHLLIFACLSGVLGVAGISAYKDHLHAGGLTAGGRDAARDASGAAPALSGGGILALSGAMGAR